MDRKHSLQNGHRKDVHALKMGKDSDILQVVKDQDVGALHRMLVKNTRGSKSKLIGSTKRLNVNYQDQDGMAALHQAALTGSTDMMRLLLDAGAAIDIEDHKGMRPLHYASWQGVEEPVAILLQWRSSANLPAHDGETPLHLAAQHGHYEVMRLLLQHHGDPTLGNNKQHKTPLHLACEFGRYRVVELLLQSNLCASLLPCGPEDTADNDRTTFLHLAAKNGHGEVIRLLLQAGVDINRSTLKGTCLHEAALYGKIEVVRLLLDCGIDVNRPDSYDQTALDIVNKFTTSRAAKELKQLLKEASYAVHARAISDHHNLYEPNSLSFKEGDYIKVLEQRADGNWKGYVMHDGHRRVGHFPSQAVVLVDSQAVVKNLPHLRYNSGHVMSPQVPDLISTRAPGGLGGHPPPHPNHTGGGGGGSLSAEHIHNPYGSIGLDRGFPPPPSPLSLPKSPSRDSDRDSGISPQHPMPPHGFSQGSQYLSPSSPGDAGPGEWGNHPPGVPHRPPSRSPTQGSSPASSNRNSAASTGSANGYLFGHPNYVNVAITSQHRLSGQSYESGVSVASSVTSSARHSYHSNSSSSSLGSLDRLEESGYSSTVNVHELFQAGYSDGEVLRAWLGDLHFEEYYPLFIQAGYDMPTISRMTPEDLTAIGITKPAHRKRLKAEISKLHIHDGIPDFKPGDIGEWCRLLGLDQYLACLVHQGYDHIDSVTDITWEDLEDVGIKLLGHQKKMMLAIERLKRIQSTSRRLSAMDHKPSTGSDSPALEPPSSYPTPQWIIDQQGSGPQHFHHSQLGATSRSPAGSPGGGSLYRAPGSPSPYGSAQEVAIYTRPKRCTSGENLSVTGKPSCELSTFQGSTEHLRSKKLVYQPDVVAIQVNRNTPVRTASVGDEGSSGPQPVYESFHGPAPGGGSSPRVRSGSADDSSVFTATAEHHRYAGSHMRRASAERTYSDDLDGLATIRRPSAKVSPRVAPKPKPVAKIVAKTKRTSRDFTPTSDIIKIHDGVGLTDEIDAYKTTNTNSLDRKLDRRSSNKYDSGKKVEKIYDTPATTVPTLPGGGGSDVRKPLFISTSQSTHSGSGFVPGGSGSLPGSPHSPAPGQCAGSPGSGGSPTGKKAPPPPPKRTNSIKSDHHPPLLRKPHHSGKPNGGSGAVESGYGNHTKHHPPKDSTPPRPPLPQNYVSSSVSHVQHHGPPPPHPQHQQKQRPQQNDGGHGNGAAYQDSVKSLSERFEKSNGGPQGDTSDVSNGMRRGSSESSTSISSLASVPEPPHYTPSDVEDFPPPPPPLSNSPPQAGAAAARSTTASQKTNVHNNSNPLSDVIEQLQGKTTARGPAPQQNQQPSRQGAQTPEWNMNDSDESDSDSGFESRKSGSSIGSAACPTGSTDTLPFANENVGTIKSRSQNSKPSIVTVSGEGDGEEGERTVDVDASFFQDSGTIKRRPKAEQPQPTQANAAQHPGKQGGDGKAGDVLNDIGNMLQDLTDELDAMLEFQLE